MTQHELDSESTDLDVRITELSGLLDTVANHDQATVAGHLGDLLLTRYELLGREADLHAGLARLHTAVAAEPDHPDAALWCYLLGVGYRIQAAEHTSPATWDIALGWLAEALTGTAHDALDRDAVNIELATVHLNRFFAQASDLDPATTRDAADRLVASITELTVAAPDSVAGRVMAMLRGVALMGRYHIAKQEADRDDAIDLLEPVLPLLPADVWLLAEAWAHLGDAHHDRFLTEDDPASLDRSILAIECALPLTAADTVVTELRFDLAMRLAIRWQLARAIIDQDRAIRYLADCLAVDPGDPLIWHTYGELLCERGDTNDSVPDLTAAISWLERAAHAAGPDEDDAWLTWYVLGHAHLRRWDLSGDAADRDQVIACFGAVMECGDPDTGLTLAAHEAIVRAAHDQLARTPDEARREAGVRANVLFDRAYQVLARSDDIESAQAGSLALVLAQAEMTLLQDAPDIDTTRACRLLGWVRTHPDLPAGARRFIDGLATFLGQIMVGGDDDYGLVPLAEAIQSGDMGESGDHLRELVAMLELFRGNATGDQAMLQAAESILVAQHAAGDDPERALIAGMARVSYVHKRGDLAETHQVIREVLERASALPHSPVTRALVPFLTSMSQAAAAGNGEAFDGSRAVNHPATRDEPTSFFTPVLQVAEAAAAVMAAITTHDDEGLRTALRRLDEMGRTCRPDHPARPQLVSMLGIAGLQLARWHPWDTAVVDAALRWHTEALSFRPGGEHPLFAAAALNLAEAHRLRGRTDDLVRSRELGLAALDAHAYQVLLQSGTDNAVDAARGAATHALRVTGWCAADLVGDSRAADDLIHALDAGRGLVLYAATTSATVAEQLTTLGYPDLAVEWTRTGATGQVDIGGLPGTGHHAGVPGDLRIRVLRALRDTQHANDAELGASARMLAPPGIAQIRTALRAHGSDALVYLVPASRECPGMAVMIPTDGPVTVLSMPELTVGPGSPVSEYAAAYQKFHDSADTERAPAAAQWRAALRALGDWAWTSAGSTLLAASAPRCTGPTPRLVLASVGMLAVVPWHAAGRWVGGRLRYLAQDAVISSIPSARLLCDIVDRGDIVDREVGDRSARDAGAALILGNPTGDLESSGTEAELIHSTFYPHGKHVGSIGHQEISCWRRARDGSGTAEELLDWLADETSPRWMLHLACHARADPKHPTWSELALAGGSASVGALLDRWPVTRLQLGTVVLSGCTTDVSGDDYDEAFSLATTFLALGARSAFGSLWLVEDLHTTLFMFMFHHFLVAEKCPPADALHQTRLWMLDPDRRVPKTLPAELAFEFMSLTPDDPSNWAGFNHLGM